MQISVRLFATLRQLAGWNQSLFEVGDGATVGDVIDAIDERAPQLGIKRRTVYVAVNQEYARSDYQLKESDEVAIFPPVSGGVR